MNKNTNTQTDNETFHMSLQTAHFFPHFFKVGKYLLPLLAGLFILAACGGGAAPTTVEQDPPPAPCVANPFGAGCTTPEAETAREKKIEECITGNAVGTATCKDAVAADGYDCLLDPFATGCTADTVDETFVEFLEPAKVARAEFCRQGNNINNAALCGNAVTTLCSANPFDTICFVGTTYRDMRIAACSGGTLPDNPTSACTTSELTDIVCVATGAKSAPFNTTICGADDGVIYAAVRQEFCRANLSDGLCTNTISTFCATIDAGKFTDALCGTSASAVLRGAYCVGLNGVNVPDACGLDATEGSLIRAYCEGGGAALSDTANCATSLANACLTAPFGHACTSDANIRARAVMCRNNTNGINSCDATRTVICEGGGVAITANIFDDLCDVGYDDPRRMACVNAPAPSVRALPSPKCGSEIAAGYLFDFCKTPDGATNNIHCPVRYAASGVRAERWQTDAVDADKNPLTPIPAGGASKDDALSNFIVGGENGLDFVVGDTITQILRENNEQNDVRLDAVTGNNEDNKSGFGWARVRLAGAELAVQDKNYVGLLSGTDVGAPIRDNSKTGVWSAKGTIFLSEGVFPLDFILDVSFGPNTIKTRATNLPSITLFGTSTLAIDGKFTDAGVLYGTTDFYVGGFANRGTLSGLIGADGAVGVFASDTLARNAYAGGFVATLGGCTDYPFNTACTSDVDIRARANACLGNIDANGTGGCDATARTICRDGTTGSGGAITANILDPLCLSAPAFVDDIIGACNNAQNNQGVFADCPAFLAEVCPISGARHADCPAQVQTGNADFILWKQDATDATNTNKLTILSGLTGTVDPTYSYVEGRADGLERGNDYLTTAQKSAGTFIGRGAADNYHRILRLSDLAGGADNTGSGVAFREFTIRDGGNRPVDAHFYAGLLSGTDLGAPISATGPITTALWDARLELTILSVLVESNFTMEVNFDPNTIETRGGANAVALRAIGNNFGLDVTKLGFHINGKFTNTGVLYGTTTLTNTRSRTSVGLLTGLIGERGAAGVFFTNDNLTRGGGIYVGGFVATPITSCEDYPFAEMCTTDADIREQLERCRDDIDTNGVGGCNATLNIICDVGSADAIVGDPFADPLCASSSLFDNALVKACVGDETRIGDFAVCDDLIEEKCPFSGSRNPECPVQVQTGNADFILWKQEAVDTDGTLPLTPTTPLTILPEVGGNDALENYVQAGDDDLNLGILADENGNLRSEAGHIGTFHLNLGNLGLADDTASGVRVDRYRSSAFGNSLLRRYYVGIFSGTDLGAPLTINNTAQAIWSAKLIIASSARNNSLTARSDFTLEVNFATKEINTRESDPVEIVFGTLTGTVILTGKFNADGVIYGTSQVKLTDPSHATRPGVELTSDGSLTGLIGEKGAVGAFISDGALDDAGIYAGGFVARNPNVCINDPFSGYCDDEASLRKRADMCEQDMNVNDDSDGCNPTIVAICSITQGSDSAINPFHGICGTDGTYAESRRLSCVNNRDGYSGSSCALLTTTICITEDDLFDDICAGTYDGQRQDRCAGETVPAIREECKPVIANFCTNNPFNNPQSAGVVKFDCNGSVAYEIARLKGCVVDITDQGVFTACPTIVASFCPISGPRHPECPVQVTVPGVTDFVRWKQDAVDTDGTTPLTILEEVGADDGDENYVQAGVDELNLGFLVDENGDFIGNPGRLGRFALDLSDVGLLDDMASGVKPERYNYSGFTNRTNTKFYVGIFSGTDLGAPLTVENTVQTIWKAQFIMVDEAGFTYKDDFSLEVDFGLKSIGTTAPINLASGDFTTGTLVLSGKFTADGVIYGTSQLKLTSTLHPQRPNEELTSDGSLTGLIGEKGAVGAFISKSALDNVGLYSNTAGRYAGGFVARNPNRCVVDPFSGYCDDGNSILARAQKCGNNLNVNGGPGGCDDTIEAICADANNDGTARDPFNQRLCYVDDTTYAESRRMACVRDKNAFIGCGGLITKICIVDDDLLNDVCAGTHDSRREFRCAGQVVDAETEEGCVPVITRLCNSDPFNASAGLGLTKFDCAGAGTYDTVRQNRLTLCLSSQTNNDPLCTQSGTLAIIALCDNDPFDTQCDDYVEQYRQARETRDLLCRGDATMRGNTACTNAGLRICDAGDSPFASVCGANDGINNAEQRVAFCNNNVADPRCTPTITAFCSTALGANLFMDICYMEDTATAFTDNRVAACQIANANTEVHADCTTLVATNCTGNVATDSPACVTAGTLPTSVWVYKAQNADGGRLEILDKVGLDDAYTNYIQGRRTGFNIDVLYDDEGNFKADAFIRRGILSITDLDNVDDNATGGVAVARISSPEFTDNPLGAKHRYYAGLLSNVDLGGPLVDNSADGIWNARFYAIYGVSGGVQTDLETSMIVNFDAKSITTRDIDDALGLADPVALSNDGGNITINAKFTTAGVIYGTSGWTDGRLDGNSSTGTVTGLIGKYGAIGAFVGSGKNIGGNTQGEYAGGFVAAPVDCSLTENPFYRLCSANISEVMMAQIAFAEICRLNAITKGCDLPINGISGLTVNDCTNSDSGNPYQTGCLDNVVFDAERAARNRSCGLGDVSNAGQCAGALTACFGSVTNAGCDAFVKATCDVSSGRDGRCDAQVPTICTNDPLNIICETAGYDEVRQTECMGRDIAMLSEDDRCFPVITALCESAPFNNAVAGQGATTFNCAAGNTYLPARVKACENNIDVNGGAGGCKATISDGCTANPFSSLCDNTYQDARDTACNVDPAAYGDGCEASKVKHCIHSHNDRNTRTYTSISNLCRDDPRYVGDRESACLRDDPNTVAAIDICIGIRESVIAYRCNIDPFNPKAGAGSRKFDCSTLDTFIVAEKTIDFSGSAKIRSDRVTFCKNSANRQDARCLVPYTKAFIERCDGDPSDALCHQFGEQYAVERAALFDECRIDASLPQCDVAGVRGGLCTIDELPFASFCNTSENIAAQVDFCNLIIDERLPSDPRCVSVTRDFCSTAFGKPVLNSICDADYRIEQVAACTADAGIAGCPTLLETNCPEGNTNPECAIATAAAWENHAVNSDNTARLDVLDEAEADDPVFNYVKAGADGLNLDFIKDENGKFRTDLIPAVPAVTREVTVIGEDGMPKTATITDQYAVGERINSRYLRLTRDENGVLTRTIADERVLKSYDGGTYEDTAKTSGVAFASINYGGFTYNELYGYQRYYAGILSGTDLGGPVTTKTEAEWTGKFGIILSGRYYTKDFTLNINFARKSINGTDTNGCTAGEKTCPVYDSDPDVDDFVPNIIEKLDLTGNFNDAGVIYGTSRVTWNNTNLFVYRDCRQNLVTPATDNNPAVYNLECRQERIGGRLVVSRGTLTGLIGERGAVGVFAGVGTNTGGSGYVGGFVVDNPAVSPDCSTATGEPFNVLLCPNADEVRRDLCINRGTTPLPQGADCTTPELMALICRGNAAPLDPLCTDDRYDDTRQLVCGGQDVNKPAQPLCAPVIEKLCLAEPFNQNAGAGANKLDCASANSDGVVQARNTRITLCLADVTKDDPLCKQGDVPAALASCANNPLDRICTEDGVRAALTVCADNLSDPICKQANVRAALTACSNNSSGVICTQGVSVIVSACVADRAKEGGPEFALCQSRGVPAVLTTCAADPFDAACTDFATQYMEARETHLMTCGGDKNARGNTKCDNARPTLCVQGGTPFAQICEGYDTTQAMMIAQTCATSATPAHEDCNTVVSAVSGGDDVLVKDCIENPYKARCSSDVFYPARAAICESEATSFTAGCLSDSDFASNYSPVEVAESRREALLARCKNPDPAIDKTGCHTFAARTARAALIKTCAGDPDETGCNTDIGNGIMLSQCIENPFLADCAGTETLARCRQLGGDCSIAAVTTALMTYRNAFVARCADSGNTDKMGCDGVVNDGKTIASCITAFNDNDCARSGAFNAYRGVDCTIPANAFAPLCQGGIGEAVITARAELALSCAVTAGGTGCNTIVSGSLTVDMCNTNPFATGCEDAAFANVRFEMCKTAEPKPAACGVKEGQRITSYVQGSASGLELGDSIYKDEDDLAVYREDDPKTKNIHEGAVYEDDGVAFDDEGNPRPDDPKTPIDESKIRVYNDSTTVRDESKNWIRTDYDANARVLREGIEQGGLTLNDLVAATGNEEHGFAYAYIPGGRGADNINGWDRYYAGLLSGTDVGAALTADAKWNGKIAIVSGLNGSILTEQANFALTIDFTDKTLTSGDIVLPKLNGLFAINGKFAGSVIYGATSLRTRQDSGELASIGSVTGLIGGKGAVGAFISSGEGALVNTFGEYAGGFVASSTAPDIRSDCSANLLNAECIANDAQYYDICVTTAEINTQATIDFCVPFVQRYIDRETECASAPLDNENHACAPVLAQLCDFNSGNIFKTEVGTSTGATKFDCTKVTAFTATRAQICRTPAYANGGAIVNLDGQVSVTKKIDACGQIITDICAGDPFTQTVKSTLTPATNLCGSTYNDARKAICMGEVSNGAVAPQRCFDTIQQVCNDNPFNEDFCFSSNFGYTATQVRLCYADMDAGGAGACPTILSTNCPDTGVRNVECRSARFTQWMDDYNTDNSDAAVASIPDDETKAARILLGRANGLDTKTNVTSILAPEFVLRLSDSKYKRVDTGEVQTVKKLNESGQLVDVEDVPVYRFNSELNEDYNSGIAVFSANTTNGDNPVVGHYAGMLSGTDVGAPLTDPEIDTIWSGDIAWVSNSDGSAFVKRAYNFELSVNYDTRKISGSGITDALAHLPLRENNDVLSLKADWDDNGILIDGTTTLRNFNPVTVTQRISQGVLTGMIGNRGVVGVFASNDRQPVAYAGGFIAKPENTPRVSPPVGARSWVTRAPGVLAAGTFEVSGDLRRSSAFTTGLEDGLGLNKGTGLYEASNYSLFSDLNDVSEFVLRLDDTKDSDGYTSGVAFFFGAIGSRNNVRFVAGLLSGTTVGQPLPYKASYTVGEESIASATWGGKISGHFAGYSDGEFGALSIRAFPDEIIQSASTREFTDTSFQLEIDFVASTIKTPEGKKGAFRNINLRFNGTFNDRGIMSGTTTASTHDSIRPRGNGIFSGIIGHDAAIGVFRSSVASGTGYIGGFVATPCGFNAFGAGCADGKARVADITASCTNPLINGGKNPFESVCSMEANQSAVALAKRDACLAHNPFPHAECQMLTSVRTACLGDSFRQVGCAARDDYVAIQSVFCTNNPNAQGCSDDDDTKVTGGDWTREQSAPLNTNPFIAQPATSTTLAITTTNEFLEIADEVDETISTMGTTKAANNTGGDPVVTTLKFSDITVATVSLGLDAEDGLAYFSGYQGATLYHYAGIFGSTDLGAPIDADITTTWDGTLSINGTSKDFTLTVVFNGSANTVDGFVIDAIDANDLLIDGDFTAKGVITGNVHLAEFTDDIQATIPTPNGSLSGLIGTDGAVAVFISTATGAAGYAGGFVATPSATICLADIFDTDCLVRTIPDAIDSFCTNTTDNLGANPFNTGCGAATNQHAVDTAKRDACLAFATFPNPECQMLDSVKMACEAAPFTNVVCATRTDYKDIRATFCGNSPGTPGCPDDDPTKVTAGDWKRSQSASLNAALATTPIRDVAPVTNEFLQIAGNTISTTGTTEAVTGGDEPEVKTLDFSDISHDGASLSADDGLVYFGGYKGGELYYYAAIYGTTDLGAPIAEAGFSATWPAMLSIFNTRQLSTHGEFRVQEFRQQEFELEVTFDGTAGTLKVANSSEFIPLTDTPNLRIYGKFDDKGVITGEVDYGHDVANRAETEQRNGTLSGLISAEGLVAVFFANADEDFNNNNRTSNNNYKTAVGGFVAAPDPQVIFADWTSSFDGGFNDAETLLASGVDATGFAANTASFITLNRANQIAVSNNLGNQPLTDPTILRLDSAGSAGQNGYESGVAFWHGDAGNAGSETSQNYAGLLVGTDLGAPLTDTTANGTWTGKIDGITNGDVLDETEVRFKVIFGDTFANGVGTIKSIANEQATYTYVTDTVGAVNVNAPNTGGVAFNNTFDFTGGFNAQGVIMGTVAHTNGEQTGTVNGVFNGLIGANGTVGVFKSNNGQDFGYIGGFVANPPSAGN